MCSPGKPHRGHGLSLLDPGIHQGTIQKHEDCYLGYDLDASHPLSVRRGWQLLVPETMLDFDKRREFLELLNIKS